MTATKVAKRTTYKFHQLGPKGRERAIEEWRDYSNRWGDDGRLSELLNNDLSDHHGLTNCKLSYSFAHCQGDGVSISGNPDIETWAQHDEHLAGLLVDFAAWAVLCQVDEPQLYVQFRDDNGHFSTYCDLFNDAYWNHLAEDHPLLVKQDDIDTYMKQAVKDICYQLEKTGYEEIEYRDSDEYIADHLEENDYEFTRSGERL